MRTRLFVAITLFACLDVGSLIFMARTIGVSGALFLVAVSTLLGLLSCARWTANLARHHEELQKRYGESLPEDLVLIHGMEGLLALVALLCFLYPGLLSDVVGVLLSFPRVQQGSTHFVTEMLGEQARREGKSVRDLFYR